MTEISLNSSTPEIKQIFKALNLQDSRHRLCAFIDIEMVGREGEDYRFSDGYYNFSVEFFEEGRPKTLLEHVFVGFDADFVKSKMRRFGLGTEVRNGLPDNFEMIFECDFGDGSRSCFGELVLSADGQFDIKDATLNFNEEADEQLVSCWVLRGDG